MPYAYFCSLWNILHFASSGEATMSTSSDDEGNLLVKGTTARASLRLQVEVADLFEIFEGDFLAVKPGSQTLSSTPTKFI